MLGSNLASEAGPEAGAPTPNQCVASCRIMSAPLQERGSMSRNIISNPSAMENYELLRGASARATDPRSKEKGSRLRLRVKALMLRSQGRQKMWKQFTINHQTQNHPPIESRPVKPLFSAGQGSRVRSPHPRWALAQRHPQSSILSEKRVQAPPASQGCNVTGHPPSPRLRRTGPASPCGYGGFGISSGLINQGSQGIKVTQSRHAKNNANHSPSTNNTQPSTNPVKASQAIFFSQSRWDQKRSAPGASRFWLDLR